MCLRLRARGWSIWSNGREMTWHDVAIDRFAQWWQRSRRTGFAFAELVDRYGVEGDPGWRRLLRSALAWSGVAVFAVIAILLALVSPSTPTIGAAVLLGALPLLQILRLGFQQRGRLGGVGPGIGWAWLIMVAKAAQVAGWAQHRLGRLTRSRATIIEYKR